MKNERIKSYGQLINLLEYMRYLNRNQNVNSIHIQSIPTE